MPVSSHKPVLLDQQIDPTSVGLHPGLHDADSGIDMRTVRQGFDVLWRYKWSILFFLIAGLLTGGWRALSETPVYQATLTMVVDPNSGQSGAGQGSVFDPYSTRYYDTQYQLLRSRAVAERVVESLDLVNRPSIENDLVPPGLVVKVRDRVASLPYMDFLTSDDTLAVEAIRDNTDMESKKRWLTSVVQGGVVVGGGERTQIVSVSYRSTNPIFAAEVANALVDAYIEATLQSQASRTEQSMEWLSGRLGELRATLNTSQDNLQGFLAREVMLDSSQSEQFSTAELGALNADYLNAQNLYVDLSQRYGERHPRLVEAEAEVKLARGRLDALTREHLGDREKIYELTKLERDVQANQQLYDVFLAKLREMDLTDDNRISNARVLDPARPPATPIYPDERRIMMMWGLGGLALGVGLAFLREQLDSRFRTTRDIEERLQLPLLGVVPLLAAHQSEIPERFYALDGKSAFAEAINHLRTGVMYSDVDEPPKVILITSSVQAEGKTTVASNLATAYARMGRTLLIDADLRRPRIKHVTDAVTTSGLVDFVAGTADIKNCVALDKTVENLYVLNSGPPPPNPLELVASEKMRKTVKALREKFDHIVIDTAPVLPASDAIALGQLSDATILVVQADRTTRHMARDALKRLRAGKVEPLGIVLAQASVSKTDSYYDGRYQYYYGGYYGASTETKA